jgi:hypothetical protein
MPYSTMTRSRSTLSAPTSLVTLATQFGLVVGLGVTAGSVLGCAPDRGPGSLVVSYTLGNNKTCAELGIEELRAELVQGPEGATTVSSSEIVPCASDPEIIFENLEPGIYSLIVSAHDTQGVATLDNLGQPATERAIEIFEAAETSVDAELTARPAQLEIAWRLGVDGFSNCASEGISSLRVTAYQVGGTSVLLDTQLDCELASDGDNGYRQVPDPDRELNGDLLAEVGIQPLDAAGAPVGEAVDFMFDPVGPGYSVQLNIECTAAGCVAPP